MGKRKKPAKSKDVCSREFYSDHERYADIINGLIYSGRQVVSENELQILDSRTGSKSRDLLRKINFENSVVIVGIENQDYIDYGMPQRALLYEAGEYERQAAGIRKKIRRDKKNVSSQEYVCRFYKGKPLYPLVTLILYYGSEPWDGETNLHGITRFSEVPEEFRKLVQNYQIHVIEVKKMLDTSMFRTDVKQVFDFIRFSDNKEALMALVHADSAFQEMEKDAYEFIAHYGNAASLLECKEFEAEGDTVNMCKALDEIYKDGHMEGKAEGMVQEKRDMILRALANNFSVEQIMCICDCSADYVKQIQVES